MNKSDFIRMIRDSRQIDRQMIGEVRELIELFPYFQSAHLLLLKGLHNTGDIKYETQLKQSAIHIADREVLYYLIKQEPGSQPEKSIVTISNTPSESEVKETTDVISEAGEIKEIINISPVASELVDDQQVVIESGKNSEELINELEKNSWDQNSGDQIVNTSMEQPGESTVLVTAESETDESASVVFILDNESEHIEETVIYMDPSFSFPVRGDLLELDEDELDTKEPAPEKTVDQKISPDMKDSKKQAQADLIEKFIIANPRIEPVRERSDHQVEDISKPFTDEHEEFVTETLAKIYVNQGYYSKAIDIYEKLCLKYPGKSSYFASQIEKVKALIK